ncbi:MAG: adenosylcobinamide-phosphate synthase CbiB [Oscillospiraceae bacterium]
MRILLALPLGALLDLLLGDPHALPHPVRLLGRWIARCEILLRRALPKTPGGERLGGVLLVMLVALPTALAAGGLVALCARLHPAAALAAESVLCYYLLAARSLRDESSKVCDALVAGDLAAARRAVSMIVGRDVDRLDAAGVARAAVETVAENASDGVLAPMLFFALGGAPLGWFYKAVSTMDSMVGYKNDRYLWFGRAAARLDDLLSYLPSRLSGLLFVLSAALCRFDAAAAFRIWRRDRRCHASPNSAQTEAACAGALGLQLAGDAWYFGTLHAKPTIGDPQRPIEPQDIARANRLMLVAFLLGLLLVTLVRLALIHLLG